MAPKTWCVQPCQGRGPKFKKCHGDETKFENTKYWTRVVLPRKQKQSGVYQAVKWNNCKGKRDVNVGGGVAEQVNDEECEEEESWVGGEVQAEKLVNGGGGS
ncbi:hypothetical protein PIB30_069092 [Stylosanthes scabra]|uniref:Uncharacterized protein n=1 Tax=Stylosanthes scabra TaxID=79078 RepID=A0ABU6RNI3_9FABA|nr:hypothetical protein [Stylosanthes scabra]